MAVGVHVFFSRLKKKMLLQVFKNEIIHTCTYYFDT
jgi:hypothetical protein